LIAGSKRKAASLQGDDHVAEAAIMDGDETINLAIDREIEREIAEIKAGRHPNLTESLESLARAKEKKIDAADRHRKMQINNINALYEYEVEDANALFKVNLLGYSTSSCSIPYPFCFPVTSSPRQFL